jgi:N-acetylglucosaminyldiphosphoundecaprenol N-acetyl-beta-D-mannosaminyltransferase
MSLEMTSSANPVPRPARLHLAGVPIDRFTMRDLLRWIASELRSPSRQTRPLLVMGPNAHIVTTAQRSPEFRTALAAADLCVADGISILLAGLMLGQPIPERVTGGDLMEQLCALAARENLSVFFLGGLPGAAEGAASALEARYPGLRVAFCCPPCRFEHDPVALATVLGTLHAAAPDILCVAIGVPRQEIWMNRHCPSLPIRLAISVGAALDTQAGLRRRAPKWTHNLGIEWAYRLAREPRRLWRRYLIGNTHFVLLVLAAWWQQRIHQQPMPASTVQVQQVAQQK